LADEHELVDADAIGTADIAAATMIAPPASVHLVTVERMLPIKVYPL
jgi:hypothetical protein